MNKINEPVIKLIDWSSQWKIPRRDYSASASRLNWNLKVWFLWRVKNQRTGRGTHRARQRPTRNLSWVQIQTVATLEGDENSHQCAILAPITA